MYLACYVLQSSSVKSNKKSEEGCNGCGNGHDPMTPDCFRYATRLPTAHPEDGNGDGYGSLHVSQI